MNCSRARLVIGAMRPNSEGNDVLEFADELAHVQACPECLAYQMQVRSSDRQLATAMQNIQIPAGLKSRLLAKLVIGISDPVADLPTVDTATVDAATVIVPIEVASGTVTSNIIVPPAEHTVGVKATLSSQAADVAIVPGEDTVSLSMPKDSVSLVTTDSPAIQPSVIVKQRSNRRRILATAGIAAAALMSVGLWWLWDQDHKPRFSIGKLLVLCQDIPETGEIPFRQSFEPQLPMSELRIPRNLESRDAVSLSSNRARGSSEIGAVFQFPVPVSRQTSFPGFLIVINLEQIEISDLNENAFSFATAEVYYPEPHYYATRVWRSEQQLFVCYVASDDRSIVDSLALQFITL